MSFVHRSLPTNDKRSKLEGFLNHRTTLINCRTIFLHLLWIPLHFNTKKARIIIIIISLPFKEAYYLQIVDYNMVFWKFRLSHVQFVQRTNSSFTNIVVYFSHWPMFWLSCQQAIMCTEQYMQLSRNYMNQKKKDSLLYIKCVVYFPKVNFVEVHKIGALQ